MSVSIRDFTDAGIIYAIEDNIGPDGYADVTDLGEALGQDNLRSLGVRLAWMKRYRMIERHPREQGRWRVARQGTRAMQKADAALTEIKNARTVEFDLIRRTVQHYTHRQNGHRRST